VTDAVYELMGCQEPVGRKTQFVDEVFCNMGGEENGLVTRDMFLAFFNRIIVSWEQTIIFLHKIVFRKTIQSWCLGDLYCFINQQSLNDNRYSYM
jgi:hypothetical protein